MRFKNFLNEGRSQYIKEEEAKELILTKCSQALKQFKKGHIIWRTISKFKEAFGVIDPSKHDERYSANTHNYYTLVMNNHSMWKDYPKREIICSGGSGLRAREQGGSGKEHLYYILPYNGAKIGICPEDDIWYSFEEVNRVFDVNDMDEFNYKLSDNDFSSDNWESFERELKETPYSEEYNMSWYDAITKTLDPKTNNFEVVNISNYNLTKSDNVEVWLDSKCVLVHYYEVDFLNRLK